MDFLKKKKENKGWWMIDESKLDEYTDEEITVFLRSHYPVGCKVDQATAYDVNPDPDYIKTINSNEVSISRPSRDSHQRYVNITVDNAGIWNSSGGRNSRKLAKIVSNGKQFQ